jgi:choline dehydrogenase-like flavoprotein
MVDTLVSRIMVEEKGGHKTALGVELAGGRTIKADREVILCAGAHRTPQVLLLSGIGPEAELGRHGIKQVLNFPDVGMNLHDHLAANQYWKLRNPGNGFAAGAAKLNDPAYALGIPLDWVATHTVPADGLESAFFIDEGKSAVIQILTNDPTLSFILPMRGQV